MWKTSVSTQRFSNAKLKKHKDILLFDKSYQLVLNGSEKISCNACPRQLESLVLGYAYLEAGLVSAEDISEFKTDQDQLCLSYEVKPLQAKQLEKIKLSSSQLISLMQQFQEFSELYRQTGIAVTVALAHQDLLQHSAEDVSLKSALYKAVGDWLKQGKQSVSVLMLSEPITETLLEHALQCGVVTVVSRSGITYQAYQKAQQNDVTCVCFCRGKNFTVYTGFDGIDV